MKPFFVSFEGVPATAETRTRQQPEQGVNSDFTWEDAFNEAGAAALKQSTKRVEQP